MQVGGKQWKEIKNTRKPRKQREGEEDWER